MARFCRQRPLVHDFEVDQARPVVLGVIKNVSGGGIAVRPAVAEFIAPKLMGAMKFPGRRSQHPPSERASLHVVPKTFAWQLVLDHRPLARGNRAKTIAIEHVETFDLPVTPCFDFAQETNRDVPGAKIKIGQIGHLLTVGVAALHHHSPAPAHFLRDRIDF